jgi:F-type H+-transporting ATPase subunit c
MKCSIGRVFLWGLWALVGALCAIVGSPVTAQAAEGAGAGGGQVGLVAIAAGIAVGIATFGAALGQGRATAAAMESIGRNPASADRIFTPMIIGLALMEALGLYGLVIAFQLQGKV